MEKQRVSYVEGIKEYLDTHKNAVPIWQIMKSDEGFEKTALNDMPLDVLKKLFIKLTID